MPTRRRRGLRGVADIERRREFMEYATRELEKDNVQSRNAGTYRLRLPVAGGMTEMELVISATNDGAGNATNPIRDVIKEIRVMTDSGMNVLKGSARELYALASLLKRVAPVISESDAASVVQTVRLPLAFARTPDDQQYGLNLGKTGNASLEIDYDLEVVRAVGAAGYVSGSFTIAVNAMMTKSGEWPGYTGVLDTRRVVNRVTIVGGPTRFKNVTAGQPVSMMLYAYESGTAEGALVKRVAVYQAGRVEPVIDSTFLNLQQNRALATGSVVTSWAPIAIAPGRFGETTLKPITIGGTDIELTEYVAAGAVKVMVESIRPYA